MKVHQFPVSYFANCFSSKKMFLNRRTLNIWQMILVIVFLIFMLLNPVALNASNTQEFKLDGIMPDLVKKLDEIPVDEIKMIKIEGNQLVSNKEERINDFVYINSSEKTFSKIDTGLNFETNQLVIKDKNGLVFKLRYTSKWQPAEWDSPKSFIIWLTEEWNVQNAPYRILSMTLLVSILVLSSTLFLVFGASFFVWLTKKNHLSSIGSFKEALNLVLNAMFLTNFLSMVIGFIYYDITLILTVQSFGLAIQLLVIFAKTKFNDGLARDGKLSIDK